MRRFQALLITAGLAAAPASAVAGPSNDPWSGSQTIEKLEWSTSKGRLGLMVMSLTPELRKHFGAAEDRGVLVAHVEPSTPAAAAGIAVGDVIVGVRGHKVDAAPDVLSALADVTKGQRVTVEILRDGKPRSVQATLSDNPPKSALDSQAWFREWMKPFDTKDSFAPFEEPSWLREWMKPSEPAQAAAPTEEPTWLRKLRELFQPAKPNHLTLRS